MRRTAVRCAEIEVGMAWDRTSTTQARQHIGQRLQAGRTGRKSRRFLELRKEIIVGEKNPFDFAVENHHLHAIIRIE
jgi:hypothetical protein